MYLTFPRGHAVIGYDGFAESINCTSIEEPIDCKIKSGAMAERRKLGAGLKDYLHEKYKYAFDLVREGCYLKELTLGGKLPELSSEQQQECFKIRIGHTGEYKNLIIDWVRGYYPKVPVKAVEKLLGRVEADDPESVFFEFVKETGVFETKEEYAFVVRTTAREGVWVALLQEDDWKTIPVTGKYYGRPPIWLKNKESRHGHCFVSFDDCSYCIKSLGILRHQNDHPEEIWRNLSVLARFCIQNSVSWLSNDIDYELDNIAFLPDSQIGKGWKQKIYSSGIHTEDYSDNYGCLNVPGDTNALVVKVRDTGASIFAVDIPIVTLGNGTGPVLEREMNTIGG